MVHPKLAIDRRLYRAGMLEELTKALKGATLKSWDIDNILVRWLTNQYRTPHELDDEVFPWSDPDVVDEELRDFLEFRGVDIDPLKVHRVLVEYSRNAIEWIRDTPTRLVDEDWRVIVTDLGKIIRLRLITPYRTNREDPRYPLLTIQVDKKIYEKLLATIHPIHNIDLEIFSTLTRYHTLGGINYQSAIPPELFDVLIYELGITHEAFASPINRYEKIPTFTGAFPDIDQLYCSLGTYQDIERFLPESGPVAIQANPPFVNSVLLDFSEMALRITQDRTDETTFAIIGPSWKDSEWYKLLASSPLTRLIVDLTKSDHCYISGDIKDQREISLCDSTVFIVSNEELQRDISGSIRRAFA